MMIRRVGTFGLALAGWGLATTATAQTELPGPERYALRVAYRFMQPTLEGDLRKSAASLGTLIDVERDLGLEQDRTWSLRGAIQLRPGHKLRGSYTSVDFKGDLEARRNFTYGDTTFLRSERVVSSVKGGYYSGEYEWDFVKGARGYLGAIVGAKFLDLDSVVVSPAQSRREQDSVRAPIPVLGAATRVYAGPLSIDAEVAGLTIGKRGSLVEFETSAGLHLSDRLSVQGGYRYLKVRAEDGDDMGDLRLSGWQLGLEISL